NIYGDRTWVEYGFRQSKSELGWADFRVTQYFQIERWWELVCSTYTLIALMALNSLEDSEQKVHKVQQDLFQVLRQEFDKGNSSGWKSVLNKVRMLLLPFICLNILSFWLRLFPNPELSLGFSELIALVNNATFSIFPPAFSGQFSFSSA
ncbi:MAG: IS701 family transposase, partial [Spirulinaceae cyanobacterium]